MPIHIQKWILRSFLIVQIASALSILPQEKKENENSGEHAPVKVLDDISKTKSLVQGKRRSSLVEKMLLGSLKQNSKLLKRLIPKNQQPPIDRQVAAEPKLSPKQLQQAEHNEEELMKMSRDVEASALLGKPFLEKKGRNDYLVIQAASVDPFVTVIPNSIYYDVEKKCVNWLDACSLQGIRSHLLQRVQYPYK